MKSLAPMLLLLSAMVCCESADPNTCEYIFDRLCEQACDCGSDDIEWPCQVTVTCGVNGHATLFQDKASCIEHFAVVDCDEFFEVPPGVSFDSCNRALDSAMCSPPHSEDRRDGVAMPAACNPSWSGVPVCPLARAQ